MSHMVETMAYKGEVPWHGLGINVDGDKTPKEMLKAAGLNWTVQKEKILTASGVEIKDRFAITRSKDKAALGICSSKYVPVQNEEAFDFFNKFVRAGKMKMETAGSLDNGQRIWGLARMNAGDFDLPGKDTVESFLLLCQPHTPGQCMTIMFTPIRVVCHNTLTYALNKTDTGKGRFKFPHRAEFDDSVKEKAELALGLSTEAMKEFKETAKYLASKRAKENDVDQFFCDLFQMQLDASKSDDYNRAVKQLQITYEKQPGAELSAGSWWQAFNAVTYYIDHQTGRDDNTRMRRAWFGPGAVTKHIALNKAMEYAKASRAL